MLIVMVYTHVKPECIEAFKEASIENARCSRNEPGVKRFDVIQQLDDPTRFILVEVYKTEAAQAAHKETTHYIQWRDAVAEMMVEARQGIKYRNISPLDADW